MTNKSLLRKITSRLARIVCGPSSGPPQTYSDFRALERALFSNDLDGARNAFLRMQNDAPDIAKVVSLAPFSSSKPRLHALQELNECLQKGDMAGAQAASTKFQA